MSMIVVNIDTNCILPEDSKEHKRIQRLRERVISAKSNICMERASIVTRIYKETEQEHILKRRTKAFDAILREISVYILEDELIVGHQSSMHRSAPIFPEFAVEWILNEIDQFETRPQDQFFFSEENKRVFRDEIVPYWKGRTFYDRLATYLSEDVALLRCDAGLFSVGLHEDGGLGHVLLDYEKVLKLGLSGIKDIIESKMKTLTEWKAQDIKKRLFYESCLSICDSVIAFANRYAKQAAQMSINERDTERKAELRRISEVCSKVPEYPATDFYEALQSFWFTQLVPQIYDNGVSISPGRFDQYMYPYYIKDITSGKITKIKAQELLEALWIKFTEPIKVYRAADAAFHAGYPMGQNLVVSGLKADGMDGTNDLSYRCLEAHIHCLLMQPNFSVRLHRNSPQDLIIRTCEAIRMGNGMPQIVNDEVYIPALLNLKVPLMEARDYVPVGCVETTPKHTWGRCNGGYFNLSKIVELTLNDGVCGITGKQVSIKTGKATDFKTFNDFVNAYQQQMEYTMEKLVKWDNIVDMVHEQLMPTPFTSMLVDDCIENGMDVTSGGARYNWTGPLGVGIANTGDSFYSIKKLVYEDKKYTMEELLAALKDDFKNNNEMREYIINRIDKYGNDIEDVDEMVKLATDIFFNSMQRFETYRGGPFVPALLPVASYVAFGMATAALPDAKKSGEPLADGISPNYGADKKGPTAVMKSVCCIDHCRCGNGVIFNQKISPLSVSTAIGMRKWTDMIRGYIALGGGHVQFNIVSADTLRNAQKIPEKYKGLVVRVAGYSAFFNELAREVQDSIIARTEHIL